MNACVCAFARASARPGCAPLQVRQKACPSVTMCVSCGSFQKLEFFARSCVGCCCAPAARRSLAAAPAAGGRARTQDQAKRLKAGFAAAAPPAMPNCVLTLLRYRCLSGLSPQLPVFAECKRKQSFTSSTGCER